MGIHLKHISSTLQSIWINGSLVITAEQSMKPWPLVTLTWGQWHWPEVRDIYMKRIPQPYIVLMYDSKFLTSTVFVWEQKPRLHRHNFFSDWGEADIDHIKLTLLIQKQAMIYFNMVLSLLLMVKNMFIYIAVLYLDKLTLLRLRSDIAQNSVRDTISKFRPWRWKNIFFYRQNLFFCLDS